MFARAAAAEEEQSPGSLLHDDGLSEAPPANPPTEDASASIANLVPFEDISRESRSYTSPDCFEGIRISVMQNASERFSTTHTLRMGGEQSGAGYEVSAMAQMPHHRFLLGGFVLNATVDGSGEQAWSAAREFRSRSMGLSGTLKAMAQVPKPGTGMLQIDSEVRSTLLGGVAKVTLVPGIAFMSSWNQAVTKSLSIGTSLQIIPSRGTGLSVGFRYAPPAVPALDPATIDKLTKQGVPAQELNGMTTDYVFTGQFASGTVSAGFARRIGERVGLAAEVDVNPLVGASEARFGMEYSFMRSRLKTAVSTSGKVSTSVVHVISPSVHGMLSAEVDHAASEYKVGVGLQGVF